MSRTSWKAAELALARYLHGERVPVTGRVRGWSPDIEHASLALEVKTRKRMPLLLKQGMAQAVAAAGWYVRKGKGERLPALVIHEDGSHFENSLVVVRLKDAIEYWGFAEVKGGSDESEEQQAIQTIVKEFLDWTGRSGAPFDDAGGRGGTRLR